MMRQISFNETTQNEKQNNAVSVPKLQIRNHSIYNKKLKVRFERFESINFKHSINKLELYCFFFEFEFKFQFKKIYFASSSSSLAKTMEFQLVQVRSPD